MHGGAEDQLLNRYLIFFHLLGMGEVKADVRATVLQEIDLITNTPQECFKRYWTQNPENPMMIINVWLGFGSCAVDSFGLTYPNTGDRSICLGDSGNSLFWEDVGNDHRAYLIGKQI